MFGQINRKNTDLAKASIIVYFMKMGLPRTAMPSVPMHRDKKTAKRKVEREHRVVQMPEKKRNQLVKTIWDKKGVTSMKLAEKMNADSSL